MTIEAWTLVAELVGALGVIVSVIYLAVQVRKGAAQAAADNLQQVLDRWVAAQLAFWGTEESSALIRRALHHPDTLTKDETNRFIGWLIQILTAYEPMLTLHRRGLINTDSMLTAERSLVGYLRTPGGAAMWQAFRAGGGIPQYALDHLQAAIDTSTAPPLAEVYPSMGPD